MPLSNAAASASATNAAASAQRAQPQRRSERSRTGAARGQGFFHSGQRGQGFGS
ncbi:hypothetical protein Hdeb2414_s0023g00629241 [Helianthus debilis subsp. tardiflorus]